MTAALSRFTIPPPLVSLIVACTLACACARQIAGAGDVSVEMTITPTSPVVGAATRGEVTLWDSAHRGVRGATVQVQGFMSHPGMAPVVAQATERDDGIYEVELRLTMAGDWILIVTGALPDGRRLNHRFDVSTARPPG